MKRMCGAVGLLLTLLIVLPIGTAITKPANSQTIPKPAAPEFSFKSYHPYFFEFILTNQPFTHEDAINSNITLSYNFRFKAHEGTYWYYYPKEIVPNRTVFDTILLASNTTTTIIKLPHGLHGLSSIPIGHEVDFQVQALIGSYSTDVWNNTIFTGNFSEWSSTVTTTIPPLPTPSVPEFSGLTILPCCSSS